jgi:Rap1a immunity proteins
MGDFGAADGCHTGAILDANLSRTGKTRMGHSVKTNRRFVQAVFGLLMLAILALLGLPAQAQQDVSSGNYLLGSCQITVRLTDNPSQTLSQYESWRDGYCRGVIEGVTTGAILSSQLCRPDGLTNSQAVRVVFKFLQDHPEELSQRGAKLVFEALTQAFPCSQPITSPHNP